MKSVQRSKSLLRINGQSGKLHRDDGGPSAGLLLTHLIHSQEAGSGDR